MVAAPSKAPDRGDLVWLRFDSGDEGDHAGCRPVLVISPRSYNERVGLALFCPVKGRARDYPFEVALPPAGDVPGVILADQIKSLDWRAREARNIGSVSPEVIREVMAKVRVLVQ